jgi:hypothetical protein
MGAFNAEVNVVVVALRPFWITTVYKIEKENSVNVVE